MPRKTAQKTTVPADVTERDVAIRAQAVTKVYGEGIAKVTALDNVSIDIAQGCFTGIMGPSGSGKSTLMHCLAGLDSIDSGQILLGDLVLSTLGDKQLTQVRRDRIGFIFQAFNLVPTLTALENIVLPLSIAGRKPDPVWLDSVIEAVGLTERLEHRPSQLSGGQQQRVACARAMVSKPDVVFADEPTGNLDSRAGADVLKLLKQSVELTGQTIVMVTHDPVAAGYTDNVVFLSDGRLVDRMSRPTAGKVLERMKNFELPPATDTVAAPVLPGGLSA